MSDSSNATSIPPDDPHRSLAVVRPGEDNGPRHIALAGGIYTILLTGDDTAGRMLCMCSPAGQEKYFMEVGDPVDDATAPPPKLSDSEQAERQKRAAALAPKYRTEFV